MILLYISVEKLVSIKYPSKVYLFRRANVQLICLVFIIAFNSVYYLPVVYHTELTITKINDTNSSNIQCGFKDLESKIVSAYLDIFDRIIIPVILIALCSMVLLVSVFRIKTTIAKSLQSKNFKSMNEDIRILVSLLVMNLFHIVLCVPIVVVSLYSFEYSSFVLYIYFAAYSLNFYVIFVANSSFRNEVLLILSLRKNTILVRKI